jgi:hypothetical protein
MFPAGRDSDMDETPSATVPRPRQPRAVLLHVCAACPSQLRCRAVEARESHGWPKVKFPADVTPETYQDVKMAFNRARTALVNDLDVLEDTAVLELTWEAKHPARHVIVAREWVAVAAMKRYRDNPQFATHKEGEAMRTPSKKGKRNRAVRFAPDTPDETRHRQQGAWFRGTVEYTHSGSHACLSAEGWCYTSFMKDWTYAVRQSRVVLVYDDLAQSETRHIYCDFNAGPDRGENEHVQRLIYMINRYLCPPSLPVKTQWVQFLAKSADVFIVCASEG